MYPPPPAYSLYIPHFYPQNPLFSPTKSTNPGDCFGLKLLVRAKECRPIFSCRRQSREHLGGGQAVLRRLRHPPVSRISPSIQLNPGGPASTSSFGDLHNCRKQSREMRLRHVSSYVSSVELLVVTTIIRVRNFPFFCLTLPCMGTVLYYPTFDINEEVPWGRLSTKRKFAILLYVIVVSIKYHYISYN